jgi:hypothetical protein
MSRLYTVVLDIGCIQFLCADGSFLAPLILMIFTKILGNLIPLQMFCCYNNFYLPIHSILSCIALHVSAGIVRLQRALQYYQRE